MIYMNQTYISIATFRRWLNEDVEKLLMDISLICERKSTDEVFFLIVIYLVFDIMHLLSFLPLKGGDTVFLDLVVSVMAGLMVYYICKWLDRHL